MRTASPRKQPTLNKFEIMNRFFRLRFVVGFSFVMFLAVFIARVAVGEPDPPQEWSYSQTWCVSPAEIVFSNLVISPSQPHDDHYDSIVCVGDTISTALQWFTLPATNGYRLCHYGDYGNWCDPEIYYPGSSPYNVINGWWNDSWSSLGYDGTNGLGNSMSFRLTNAAEGRVWYGNISAQFPTTEPVCGWYATTYSTNTPAYLNYAVVGVGSLTPNFGGVCAVDISPTDNPGSKWIVSTNENSDATNFIVTATPHPNVDETNLPSGWTMTGGTPVQYTNGQTSRTQVSVDTTPYGTKVVMANSGLSHATNTFIVTAPVKMHIQTCDDTNKYDPGAILFLNSDDDDADGIRDMDETNAAVNHEDDLLQLTFTKDSPSLGDTNTLYVSTDWHNFGGQIKIWRSPHRGPDGPVIDTAGGTNSFTFVDSNMPTLYIEGIQASRSDNDVFLSVSGNYTPCSSDRARITVMQMQLGADVTHTHQITLDTLATNYFWVNDVGVSGDIISGTTDVPGSGNNGNLGHVNGRCDVENFFPVGLDFENVFGRLSPTNGYEYRLIGSGVRFAYTSLPVDNAAFNYLTDATGTSNYGSSFTSGAYAADTVPVNGYAILNTSFLTNAMSHDNMGLILMEGSGATKQPLKLEVWKDGQKIGGCGQLNLSIDSVENMYRSINLRNSYSGPPAAPSNYPTNICTDKMFVFVHGYNVNANASRGWNAEIFKRIYQSGSRAMFTAVDWQGDDGQWPFQLPVYGYVDLNYYINVVHAFDTALYFAMVMRDLPGAQKFIAAHSLGNMVVSSAIEDWSQNSAVGFQYNTYFKIDAAVAIEAYDKNAFGNPNMMNPDWKNYDCHVWASYFWSLFDASDGRYGLTWRGRFADVSGVNYYSSTEDVLTNAYGQLPSVFSNGDYVWVSQEMRKGTWLASLVANSEAGWGFNSFYGNLTTNQANALTVELRTNSFFKPFDDSNLYNPSNGSTEAVKSTVREKVLADGIPALSNAAGGPDGANLSGAYNMSPSSGVPWPRLGSNRRCLHSDIKNIAYPYNYYVFQNIAGYLK